jgi:hypothetical protein
MKSQNILKSVEKVIKTLMGFTGKDYEKSLVMSTFSPF